MYCLCIAWCICVALTSSRQLEGMWLCVYVYVCVFWEMNSPYQHTRILIHTVHTYRHACGWLVYFVPAVLSSGAGTLFDPKSIIVHLNNLACVWINCVGMIYRNWILLNMHFCVHLKTAELKKKKTVMSNLFIVVSVLLENPVFRSTLYIQCCTLQRYTLFWYNIVQ